MYHNSYTNNNVEIIDLIIKSLNDSILLLEQSTEINQIAYDAVCNILKFLNGTIELLPIIIFSKGSSGISKNDLIYSFEEVISKWAEYFIYSDEFYIYWKYFLTKWDKYKNDLLKSDLSSRTIHLSMN